MSKLPGNRRKPWRVRVTSGWTVGADGKSRQTYKVIGYYESREAAMEALAEYHKYPLMMESRLTFSEVYAHWSEEKYPTISPSSARNYTVAYKACEPIYNVHFDELKLSHLQMVIDTCGKNYPSLEKIRLLFNQLFQYAMKQDICHKDYSVYVSLKQHKPEEKESKHKIFTSDEIKLLWENADRSWEVRAALILICSGLRIGELLDLAKDSVNLDERYIKIKKSKTASGVRIVPIAECVLPFWRDFMERDGSYVIQNRNDHFIPMQYQTFLRSHYNPILTSIGMVTHYPHDTRYTFASIMTSAGIAPVVLKRIIGHKSKDITERVYTHFEIKQMLEAVNVPDWTNPFHGIVSVL